MLTRAPAWVITALVAVLGVIVIALQWDRNDDLKDKNKELAGTVALHEAAREADQTALTHNVRAKDEVRVQDVRARKRIDKALEANPDWASEPIPADVLDSLRD
jgi:hypothetical protein